MFLSLFLSVAVADETTADTTPALPSCDTSWPFFGEPRKYKPIAAAPGVSCVKGDAKGLYYVHATYDGPVDAERVRAALTGAGFRVSGDGRCDLRGSRGNNFQQFVGGSVKKFPTNLVVRTGGSRVEFVYEVNGGMAIPTKSDWKKLCAESQSIWSSTQR